ncbi:MAG: hypothetical protein PWQ27_1628 [Kosmotoga sp.]|nr:hypothetical protein [Kosmotoga sp.]
MFVVFTISDSRFSALGFYTAYCAFYYARFSANLIIQDVCEGWALLRSSRSSHAIYNPQRFYTLCITRISSTLSIAVRDGLLRSFPCRFPWVCRKPCFLFCLANTAPGKSRQSRGDSYSLSRNPFSSSCL